MQELTDERFHQLIDEALGELPKRSLDHLKNVAILFEDEQIKHTLWHEIAHYYGLNHTQIHEKE
jgi:predicted Zn-dependent protease with MMP-like domain